MYRWVPLLPLWEVPTQQKGKMTDVGFRVIGLNCLYIKKVSLTVMLFNYVWERRNFLKFHFSYCFLVTHFKISFPITYLSASPGIQISLWVKLNKFWGPNLFSSMQWNSLSSFTSQPDIELLGRSLQMSAKTIYPNVNCSTREIWNLHNQYYSFLISKFNFVSVLFSIWIRTH